MKYEVLIQPPAVSDLEAAYLWLRHRSPAAADKWYNGLLEAVASLEQFPNRCGIAPETKYFDIVIRQLLYGRRRYAYRVLFTVRGNSVHILHIRHGARRTMERDEIRLPPP